MRRQLGAELGKLRSLSGLSQRAIAKAVRVSQSTVLRAERGEQLLSAPAVGAWLQETGADVEMVDRVIALLDAAHSETRVWSDLLAEQGHLQEESRLREQASSWVRNFQPTTIPGLLQTSDYARAVLEIGHTLDPVSALASRLERQLDLHHGERRYSFLIAEAALRWSPGPGCMVGQVPRIASVMKLDTVEVAVVPTSVAELIAWNNFVLHEVPDGDPYVTVELIHGQVMLLDPGTVSLYESSWRALWEEALHGEEAVSFMRKVIEPW